MIFLLSVALADETVYAEGLAPGWSDWSWSAEVDLADTGDAWSGTRSLHAVVSAYGAVSLHTDTPFAHPALSFHVRGDPGDLALMLEADGEGVTSDPVPLTDLATVSPDGWVEVVVDLTPFGAHDWTRIDLFVNGPDVAEVWVDELVLLDEGPVPADVLGVEPVGPSTLLVWGAGDASGAQVWLDAVAVPVDHVETATGPARSYLHLGSPLAAGALEVRLGDTTWTRSLRAATATLDPTPGASISPLVYGVAFPDPADVASHGYAVARWGGNATTLYNPDGYTNHAADWYFENSGSDDAGAWVATMHEAGAATFLSVPALDWVAKDDSSCAYSVRRYGAQQSTDPWNSDCGNGVTPAGVEITWNDPADAYTPWTAADAAALVAGLPEAPTWVAVANELDIASSTHRDAHPEPMGYDELFDRWYTTASAIADAAPGVELAGPSSCCWWFYWNSDAGESDKAAHGGQDLLPWWLDQVAAADAAAGRRTLTWFDVHYYPNDVFNDDVSAATRAERLRSTRSLWDPTYTDEGWIGTDEWATQTQPDRNQVQLVPRMKALLEAHYPGTRFALTEWNWGAEGDLSGGLAVADVLGILGREGVDMATYWTTPAAGTPAAEAFRLYRDPALPFGDRVLDVAFADPDLLGVYAAADGAGLTLVVVNKDPDHDLLLDVSGLPTAARRVRHFSATSEGALTDDLTLPGDTVVAVPAYGALFLAIGAGGDDTGTTAGDDTGTSTGDDTATPETEDTAADIETPGVEKDDAGCGCASGRGSGVAGALVGLLALTRRRAASPG